VGGREVGRERSREGGREEAMEGGGEGGRVGKREFTYCLTHYQTSSQLLLTCWAVALPQWLGERVTAV